MHLAKGRFIDLSNFYGADLQPAKAQEAIGPPGCPWHYIASPEDLMELPGCPIAYKLHPRFYDIFRMAVRMGDIADVREGINTGNNDRFLRFWYEVDFTDR